MKETIVYMPWIAFKLRAMGFQILRTEINPHKPQFDIYVFEDTASFREAFTRVSQKK